MTYTEKQLSKPGAVYYVRLKTDVGPLYKLGYTSMGSVHERFAFNGRGDEKLIERVICFQKFEDAYRVEQELHAHLGHRGVFFYPDPEMPMFGNGQSEIYDSDVLNLDSESSKEEVVQVREAIGRRRQASIGLSKPEIDKWQENSRKRAAEMQDVADAAELLRPLLEWWARLFSRIFGTSKSRQQREFEGRVAGYLSAMRENAELLRLERAINRRKRLKELLELAAEEERRGALKAKIVAAIGAFKQRNLQAFEEIVDPQQLSYRLAEAMTDDYVMPSDYLEVPNNLELWELLEEMGKGDCRNILIKPIEKSYVTLLRHLVATHEFMDFLPLPPSKILKEDPEVEGEDGRSPLNIYFNPKSYLDDWTSWVLPDVPIISYNGDCAELSIEISNAERNLSGQLLLRVRMMESGMLDVDFPNLLDIDKLAFVDKHPDLWHRSNSERRKSKML